MWKNKNSEENKRNAGKLFFQMLKMQTLTFCMPLSQEQMNGTEIPETD